ncbi:MAG TPA: hypothetical protein VKF40_16315 [Burkholderiales bacterium]|nr:hypothetical protein [Burkholderiales bacterium]
MLASLGASSALAVDLRFTGFATIGYAISDQDFRYLRYIDNDGTFKADSLAGVQAEAQFDPKWGATLQLVASAPRTRDDGYEAKVRWAFVSFRPDNDWLIRAGRLRPPFFINTQNAEVGVTYDQARLPQEVYSLSPVYDFDGGAITKTWLLGESELALDGYWGQTDLRYRFPQRDAPVANFRRFDVTSKGLVFSRSTDSLYLRGGFHRVNIQPGDARPAFVVPSARAGEPPIVPTQQLIDTFVPLSIPGPSPFGGTLYLPGNSVSEVVMNVIVLSADWHAGDWRVTGEYGQRSIKNNVLAPGSKGLYATVARRVGKWTPYWTHARLRSDSDLLNLYEAVNGAPVPLLAQLSPPFFPANFHRVEADAIAVYDQYSNMLGVSFAFSATSKLKFEWMRTHVGLTSSLVDGDVHNKSFNVFSVSYSVAF